MENTSLKLDLKFIHKLFMNIENLAEYFNEQGDNEIAEELHRYLNEVDVLYHKLKDTGELSEADEDSLRSTAKFVMKLTPEDMLLLQQEKELKRNSKVRVIKAKVIIDVIITVPADCKTGFISLVEEILERDNSAIIARLESGHDYKVKAKTKSIDIKKMYETNE